MALGGNLLTIGEVLEKMLEGNESDFGVARRAEVGLWGRMSRLGLDEGWDRN